MIKNTQIKFEIKQPAYEKISEALEKYGDYEIGGMLIGNQKGRNYFSILDTTIADDIGKFSIGSFIREPMKSLKIIIQSFKKKKYNYIGEWHSHPGFDLYPSKGDIATMQGILADPGYGVNFVLLIITKLKNGKVDMGGFLFHKSLSQFVQATIIEGFCSKGTTNIKI